MAEKKYDLALAKFDEDKLILPKPWYKERLRTKYIKTLKPGETLFKNLDGNNWQFIKDGLDDFRDGLPPSVPGDDIIPPYNRGTGPAITNTSKVNYVKQRAAEPGRFTKDQILYSPITPYKEQRIDNINDIEDGLLQHPLALYPHLEESVTSEVFEDVVNLLDPQINVKSRPSSVEASRSSRLRVTPKMRKYSSVGRYASGSRSTISRADVQDDDTRNPYYWLPKREEALTGAQKKNLERKERSKAQEEHIHNVTKEFCDWVSSLGGDTNNVEEATITSLFASGYETKPALSVPIQIVELSNVPLELRMSAAVGLSEMPKSGLPQIKKLTGKPASSSFPTFQKFNYGAWYLPPGTWKKRDYGEALRDPKEVKEEELKAEQKNDKKLNTELAQIHGTSAFMNFMDRKGTRQPEFIDEIKAIQKHMAEEEKRRRDEEHLAKMKRFPSCKNKIIV